MLYRKIIKPLIIFALLQGIVNPALKGQDIQLEKVTAEKGFLNFWIKAIDKDGNPERLDKNKIKIKESFKGEEFQCDIYSLQDSIINQVTDDSSTEQYSILCLLDLSKEMSKNDVRDAKKEIQKLVNDKSSLTNNNIDFYLTAFNESRIRNRVALTNDNVDSQLSKLPAADKKSDYYRILFEEIRFLNDKPGKKVLIILGTGYNDVEGLELYDRMIPYVEGDIGSLKDSLKKDFNIFSIDFADGKNYNALRKPVSELRFLSQRKLPDEFFNILENKKIINNTHLVKVIPKNHVFRGELRNYTLQYNDNDEGEYSFGLGSIQFPISILVSFGIIDWLWGFVVGAFIILFILGICSVGVPMIQKQNFRNKHVQKYVPDGLLNLNDPVYNEPIKEGELVVRKCQQVVPFSTWEDVGGQCPNYPDCLDPKYLGCNGAGAPISDRFFSMKGAFRQLNWMWFGAVGGFIAWVLFALFNYIGFDWFKKMVRLFLANDSMKITGIDKSDSNLFDLLIDSLSNDLLIGVTFGIGLIFMLSWMMERSESRELSWTRIIIRVLFGVLVSTIIFFTGFYVQKNDIISDPYLSLLVTWLFFGAAVGIILSVKSNITILRGVLGGLIAALIAYFVYIAIEVLFEDFIGARLFSSIILGGVLGVVLVSVISQLENFELEIIAPKGFQNVPISKWLKNQQDIMIGKEPGCYVYIKWDDPAVIPQHAQLLYANGTVFLQPLAETLVNKKIIPMNKKTTLKNKDIIQLGRDSKTIIRYKEKRVVR